MTNSVTTPSAHSPDLKSFKTLNTRWILAALLIITGTCVAYIFLEIPVVEHFNVPHFRTFPLSPGLDSKPSPGSGTWFSEIPESGDGPGVLSQNTAQGLDTLDLVIERFNDHAARSSGLVDQYTGHRDVIGFLTWTLGKLLDMSTTLKDYKSQIEGVKSLVNEERVRPHEDTKHTLGLDRLPGKFATNKATLNTTARKDKERLGGRERLRASLRRTKQQPARGGGGGVQAGGTRTRLVLFSTWIDKPEKRDVHDNVLRTWRLWAPLVVPLVFTNNSNIASRARTFGWKVLREPLGGCTTKRVPLLREMFRSAMANFDSHLYAYVNGDLLLGNGMLSTIEAIVQDKELMGKPLLGLINRTNVDFYNKKREPVYTLKSFDSLARDGKVMTDGSSDGFITNKLFPWQHVPNIVPGRKGVAMWLVSYAREMGVATVDVSGTLRAVHMMATQAGNNESRGHPGFNCNHNIYNNLEIKPRSWFCGFLKCARYRTTRDHGSQGSGSRKSTVWIENKSAQNHPRCSECAMDLAKLKSTVY